MQENPIAARDMPCEAHNAPHSDPQLVERDVSLSPHKNLTPALTPTLTPSPPLSSPLSPPVSVFQALIFGPFGLRSTVTQPGAWIRYC